MQSHHYVLICDPGRERQAVQRLGPAAYSPAIMARRVMRGRVIERQLPMFPCYAFISLAQGEEDWPAITATRYVRRFLTIEGRPAALPQAAIDAIKAKEIDLHRLYTSKKTTDATGFEIGQRVMVKVGPFADMLARIERFDAKGRAEVLLDLFGAKRTIPVERAELIAA